MAFLERVPDKRNLRTQRFSLLLLPHNDVYFNDYSANLNLSGKSIEGRLKVCASCVVFDPKDFNYPIHSFPFKDIQTFETWTDRQNQREGFYPFTPVLLKEANIVKPWQFERPSQPQKFDIALNYMGTKDLLDRLLQLHDAWIDKSYTETQSIITQITNKHQSTVQFNMGWIEDLAEHIVIEKIVALVMPLTRNPGRVILTNSIIYFQPFNNIDSEPVTKYFIDDIKSLVTRRYLLRDVGLEMFFRSGDTLYLSFATKSDRKAFMQALLQQPSLRLEEENQDNMMIAWQNGAVSNFDYLMYLNNLADRSFTDLAQYPVFPWVIKDYSSQTLDLENPETFRDLSKPIGAQNPERLQEFLQRYNDMPDPKFHYGTHYSTPGYVLFYTIRAAPEYSLNLQNGKFDKADRLFQSMARTWNSAFNGMADVKELIPEFYMDSTDFLLNRNNLDLGTTQSGQRVGDVILPTWASDASDFLKKCRQALECDYVSERIHNWIDLIFGYKQTGPEAIKAHNLFYYLTYEGEIDLDSVTDPAERKAYELQIMEFGQTPRFLFTIPHPPRRRVTIPRPLPVTDGKDVADESTTISDSKTMIQRINLGVPIVVNHADEKRIENFEMESNPTSSSPQIISSTDSLMYTENNTAQESSETISSQNLFLSKSITFPFGSDDHPNSEQQNETWSHMIDLSHMATLLIHRDGITDIKLSANNQTLYTISQDARLKIHDLTTHQEILALRVGDSTLSSIQVLPDQDGLLISSWDSQLYIVSIHVGSVVHSWQGHHDAVSVVRTYTSNSGDLLAVSASWDGSLKVWRLTCADSSWSHSFVTDLGEHAVDITALAVHAQRQLAVTADNEGHIALWNLATFSEQRRISDLHYDTVNDIAFTPDGCRFITSCIDCTIKVVNVDSLVEAMVVNLDDEPRCIMTDGTFLLFGSDSGEIQMWDTTHRTQLQTLRQHKASVRALAVASNALCVVSGDDDGYFTHWTIQTEHH
eukprot:gene8922-1264_t